MKPLLIMLLSAALIASTGSKAQGVNAPSSVSANSLSVQPLSGTLFFGPQQREKMDRARKAGVAAATANVDEVPEIASVLNGFVKRSDGQVAIWVDGEPRYQVQGLTAQGLQPVDVGGSADNLRERAQSVQGQTVTSSGRHPSKPSSRKLPRKKSDVKKG